LRYRSVANTPLPANILASFIQLVNIFKQIISGIFPWWRGDGWPPNNQGLDQTVELHSSRPQEVVTSWNIRACAKNLRPEDMLNARAFSAFTDTRETTRMSRTLTTIILLEYQKKGLENLAILRQLVGGVAF
jgi:hypothetical protein